MLYSYSHETFGRPQLYETDPDFATTCQILGANTVVDNFHLQYGLLCCLDDICVPSSERAKMIWESHYSRVAGHFGVENTVVMLQNISTGRNFDMMLGSILGPTLPALLLNRPLRNRACTPLFLLLIGHGNPYQWTTCRTSHPPSGEMTVFFVVVDLLSKMAILVACKKNITT